MMISSENVLNRTVSFSIKSLVPEKTPSVQDPQMKNEEHGADRLALDAGSDIEVVAPEPWTSMSVIGSGRLLPYRRIYGCAIVRPRVLATCSCCER